MTATLVARSLPPRKSRRRSATAARPAVRLTRPSRSPRAGVDPLEHAAVDTAHRQRAGPAAAVEQGDQLVAARVPLAVSGRLEVGEAVGCDPARGGRRGDRAGAVVQPAPASQTARGPRSAGKPGRSTRPHGHRAGCSSAAAPAEVIGQPVGRRVVGAEHREAQPPDRAGDAPAVHDQLLEALRSACRPRPSERRRSDRQRRRAAARKRLLDERGARRSPDPRRRCRIAAIASRSATSAASLALSSRGPD